MARGIHHALVGLILGCISFLFLPSCMQKNLLIITIFALCSVAGALFPDIDVKSRGRAFTYRLMVPIYIIMLLYGYIYMFLLIGVTAILPLFTVHRGLFHRFWFITAYTIVWSMFLVMLFPEHKYYIYFGAYCFGLGVLSHLYLDFGLNGKFKLK